MGRVEDINWYYASIWARLDHMHANDVMRRVQKRENESMDAYTLGFLSALSIVRTVTGFLPKQSNKF